MAEHYPFSLRPLPYQYDALEPNIDATTMYLHHNKHLGAYVENLNKALAPYPRFHDWSLTKLLFSLGSLPRPIQTAVRNNGGGVYNHNLYFAGMTPNSGGKPVGALARQIEQQYGSTDFFLEQLKAAAMNRFGSGWAWLVWGTATGEPGREPSFRTPASSEQALRIFSTPNQDVPFPWCPILLVDVWEHAYYLKYQNRRAEYFDNWAQTINWELADERFRLCAGLTVEED